MKRIQYDSEIGGYWWVPLLTGLVCLGLGIWTLVAPSPAMILMAYVFAVGLVVAGGTNVIFSIAMSRYTPGWGWTLALGILELLAGIWMLALPEPMVVETFVYVTGFFIIIAAINSLCEALTLSVFSIFWTVWAVILLIATIVLGALFLSGPISGGVVVWLWIGLSFVGFGLYRVVLSFRLRSLSSDI